MVENGKAWNKDNVHYAWEYYRAITLMKNHLLCDFLVENFVFGVTFYMKVGLDQSHGARYSKLPIIKGLMVEVNKSPLIQF